MYLSATIHEPHVPTALGKTEIILLCSLWLQPEGRGPCFLPRYRLGAWYGTWHTSGLWPMFALQMNKWENEWRNEGRIDACRFLVKNETIRSWCWENVFLILMFFEEVIRADVTRSKPFSWLSLCLLFLSVIITINAASARSPTPSAPSREISDTSDWPLGFQTKFILKHRLTDTVFLTQRMSKKRKWEQIFFFCLSFWGHTCGI